jgi:hypothetical protein
MDRSVTDEQPLLLKPRPAATTLDISERQLWQHTAPRGPIPCVRIGSCVRYSPEALRAFIDANQTNGGEA